jgi:hypothetical protein
MKYLLVVIGIVVAVLALILYPGHDPQKAQATAMAGRSPAVSESQPGEKRVLRSQAAGPTLPEAVAESVKAPAELEGFMSWTAARRLDVVTAMQGDPQLSPETVSYLKMAIRSKELDDVTRNNMANALLIQDVKDPFLSEAFADMIQDESENERWREYSVQHLAGTLPFARNPKEIIATLMKIGGQRGSVAGTAILHLSRIDTEGGHRVGNGIDELIERALQNNLDSDPLAVITILGVMGERQMHGSIPLIRAAAGSKTASVRRSAIAALGLLGDAGSKKMIESALNDEDELVSSSARTALERVDAQLKSKTATEF